MSDIDSKARPQTRKAAPVRRTRLIAVVAAAAGTAIVHAVATAAGAAMEAPMPGQGIGPVTMANSVIAALVASGLGWAARALLDRFAPRKAAVMWLAGATIVFVLEIFPPLLAEATPGTKAALLMMHVVVAAAMFPVFARRRPAADA
ncbi:DUF6069 family protein [Glycomyces sp. TRM65418]|uniref:DUF6069 family protein n=1 Tax=Glycomyces sp. TRM65418 TaxID=2867006 RepID=UPI001CE6396B|nr:DUF6069 family protein [Glycomyces sp. TRM65418]MCC3765777.1 DUF6069 family protein [Glycomyces sp. TRM65418]QZD55367.1 hypothetical protein K3N28_22085 [Glycomyces sp. TRM65418]